MAADTTADAAAGSEAILAELELSRVVTVQLAVVGTLGFWVALGAFGGCTRPPPAKWRPSGSSRPASPGGTRR